MNVGRLIARLFSDIEDFSFNAGRMVDKSEYDEGVVRKETGTLSEGQDVVFQEGLFNGEVMSVDFPRGR
jgi:hypothetical protein